MEDRRTLALAAMILPVLAAGCLALGVLLLGDAGSTLPRAWAFLTALPRPSRQASEAVWSVIGQSAAVSAICGALGLGLGWALGRLPLSWALVGGAMLSFPSTTLAFAWALGFGVMLHAGDGAYAARTAAGAVGLPARPGMLLVVLLAPILARSLAHAWRARVDQAASRAAISLGVSPARLFLRATLAALFPTLSGGMLLIGLAAAAVLAVDAEPAPALAEAAGLRALAAVLAIAALGQNVLRRAVEGYGRGPDPA